jgi:hypothetical protein
MKLVLNAFLPEKNKKTEGLGGVRSHSLAFNAL